MPAQQYTDLIAMLRRGTLLEDAANELAVLVASVEGTGKPGTLTLELKIEPAKGEAGGIVITDKLTLKEPKPDVAQTLAYVMKDGTITRRDPRQQELAEGPHVITENAHEDQQTG